MAVEGSFERLDVAFVGGQTLERLSEEAPRLGSQATNEVDDLRRKLDPQSVFSRTSIPTNFVSSAR